MAVHHAMSWRCRIWLSVCLALTPSCASGPSHAARWQTLAEAAPLHVASMRSDIWLEAGLIPREPGQRLVFVRLPHDALLSVHSAQQTPQPAQAAEAWGDALAGPTIVWNAGFYGASGAHMGWLKAGGRWLTSERRGDWQGLLLTEPLQSDLAAFQILDVAALADESGLWAQIAQYGSAVQTMVLLDAQARLRTADSSRKAARTALALDTSGRLLVVLTEGATTLAELAQALRAPHLGVTLALNLDGGLESQLAIDTPEGHITLLSRDGSRGRVPAGLFTRMTPRALPSVIVAHGMP